MTPTTAVPPTPSMEPSSKTSAVETKAPSLSAGCEAWNACSEQNRCQSGSTQIPHDTFSSLEERYLEHRERAASVLLRQRQRACFGSVPPRQFGGARERERERERESKAGQSVFRKYLESRCSLG